MSAAAAERPETNPSISVPPPEAFRAPASGGVSPVTLKGKRLVVRGDQRLTQREVARPVRPFL
jgi:hypothetical protein